MLGAVKLTISRDGIACGLVWERPVKVPRDSLGATYIGDSTQNYLTMTVWSAASVTVFVISPEPLTGTILTS